jgi:protein-tyrosine phosphatase
MNKIMQIPHNKVSAYIKRGVKNWLATLKYFVYSNSVGNISLNAEPRIHFLCQGNICRSPFAEHLARQLAKKHNIEIRITSSGLGADQAEKPPDDAIITAKNFNIDLDKHRPQRCTNHILEECDLVIGMHYAHFKKFKKKFPDHHKKFFLLKHFAFPSYKTVNITDPYSHPCSEYQRCFNEINDCVDLMMNALSGIMKRTR